MLGWLPCLSGWSVTKVALYMFVEGSTLSLSLSLLLQQVTTVDPYSDHSYYIWILQSPDRDEILVFPESPLHKV